MPKSEKANNQLRIWRYALPVGKEQLKDSKYGIIHAITNMESIEPRLNINSKLVA